MTDASSHRSLLPADAATAFDISTRRLLPGEDGSHFTFCRICEAFCGLTAEVKAGRIVKIGPDRDNPHSKGHLCLKGPAMKDVVYDVDRVTQPLKRAGAPGAFVPVSWDEALDDIARRLHAVSARGDGATVGAYLGNPKSFNMGSTVWRKLLGAVGVDKYFTAGSQDSNARHVASHILYGSVVQMALPDLPRCDHLLIFGGNPLASHGSVITAPRIREDLDAIAERGRVIVIDPRRTETAAKFEHIPVRPGSDVWLLAAMIRTLFAEGLADIPFLDRQVVGWLDLRAALDPFTVELAAEKTSIAPERILQLACEFAAVDRAAAYSRLGLCRGRFSTLANLLVDALNIVAGKFGKEGGWVFGEPAIDLARLLQGGYAEQLSRIGGLPSVVGVLPSIVLPQEILTPGESQIRALGLVCGNPVVSGPGGDDLTTALQELDLFFAIDMYVNETNRYADYILPATSFLEREDIPLLGFAHMVRPFAQYTDAVIPPRGEARVEHEILADLADRISLLRGGEPEQRVGSALSDMLDHLLRSGPNGDKFGARPEGLSMAKLKAAPHGVMISDFLACEDWSQKVHNGEKIVFWNPAIAKEFDRLAADADDDRALRLFGRRDIRWINSWMHNVDRLVRSKGPTLMIHPDDAQKRGLRTGDRAQLSSASGKVTVEVDVTTDVIRGAVSYPHGWGHHGGWNLANEKAGANINFLAPRLPHEVEQISGASLLDGIPVKVEAIAQE